MTLGVYPRISLSTARARARKALGQVADNKDPSQTRRASLVGETFGELAELYLEKHAKVHKRSWTEDRRIIHNERRSPHRSTCLARWPSATRSERCMKY